MKRITNILIAVLLLTTSCNSDLLDPSPSDSIGSVSMWTSEALADKGMLGLYTPFYQDQLTSTQLSRVSRGLNRVGIEAMGFNTDYYSNNYPVGLLYNSDKRANDFQIVREWKTNYTIIHLCNDAIANLHKAGLSEEKLNRYQCEARFLRAWAYRRLNMLYQGVPIYLEPVTNAECIRSQSPAEEVWKAVLDDLTYCIDNKYMPNNTLTSGTYGRPSKGAAYAMRGMAYMWTKEYDKAADDFSKVKGCGYGLWGGTYGDFFKPENEKDAEMIFALQYAEDVNFSDNIQQILGARDTYGGWGEVKPSTDFVDYYQNANGSEFKWSDIAGLEDWDLLTPAQREIFFCRNNLASYPTQANQVLGRVGQTVWNKYYLPTGNEERIKKAYANRDPRLKQTVVTPYEKIPLSYTQNYNNDENMVNKEARWPLVAQGTNGGDFWLDKRTSAFYCYKKYVEFEKGRLISRDRGHTDWPLIRYTDVLLQWAEALTHEEDIPGAISLVNEVRTRAGMPNLTNGGSAPNGVSGTEDMLERIRYERRVEFCVEGINFFDEVRWGTYKDSKFQGKDTNGGKSWWGDMVEYTWYYSDIMWPWSAPASEAQKNPAITRRAGWIY